jgi:hypothetical protein
MRLGYLDVERSVQFAHQKWAARDVDILEYHVATLALRFFLGKEWFAQCLVDPPPNVSTRMRESRRFLRTGGRTLEDRIRHQVRVCRLAELIYVLQHVEGIDRALKHIVEGQLESTIADLEFAVQFNTRGVEVQFVAPSGLKGNDHDLFAVAGDSRIPCEVKCRIEATSLREGSVQNALRRARKQLPATSSGVVGVKVPAEWLLDGESLDRFDASVESFLKNTSRVVAVVVRWEEVIWHSEKEGGLVLYLFSDYANPRQEVLTLEERDMVRRLSQRQEPSISPIRIAVQKFLENQLR